MTEHKDYSAVDVPQDKHPTEYTYTEKRADIVRLWRESTDPFTEITATQLKDRYGNAKSTLHDDIQIVKAYLRANIGADDELKNDLGFDRSIRKLEQQGKWYKAAQVRKDKWEWLQESGHKDKQPDQHEFEHSGQVDREHTLGEEERAAIREALTDV